VIALEARMEKAEETIRQLAPYLDLDKVIGPMPVLPSDKKEGEEDSPLLASSAVNSANPRNTSTHPSRQASDQSLYEEVDNYEAEDDEDAAYLQVSLDNMNLDEGMPAKMVAAVNKKAPNHQQQEIFRIDSNAVGFNDVSKDKVGPKTSAVVADAPMQFLGRASNFHILPLLEKMSQNNNKSAPLQPDETSEALAGMICRDSQEKDKDYSSFDFSWPDSDLRQTLMNAYFGRHNRDMPILNEVVTRKMLNSPSREWKDGRTIMIALGLFSLASRYVEDDRLFLPDGSTAGANWHKLQKVILTEEFPRHGTAVMFIQSTLMSITCESSCGTAKG